MYVAMVRIQYRVNVFSPPTYWIWEGYIPGRGGDIQGGASEGGGTVTGGGALIIWTNLCACECMCVCVCVCVCACACV